MPAMMIACPRSRCRVGVEEDRLSETDHNDHTNYIQGDVPRRRSRIREGGFKYEEKYREQDGDKDDLCPESLIDKEKRQDDADYFNRNKDILKKFITEYRNSAEFQCNNILKSYIHEKIDSHGDDESTEEDRGEIF